jgi:hypothetical protein
LTAVARHDRRRQAKLPAARDALSDSVADIFLDR